MSMAASSDIQLSVIRDKARKIPEIRWFRSFHNLTPVDQNDLPVAVDSLTVQRRSRVLL